MAQSASFLFRIVGQAILYALFAGFVLFFSSSPSYSHLDAEQGLLRLSFRHPGKIATDCRQRTPEELAKLPPQLRAELDCERERSPVRVRIDLDGALLFDRVYEPAGLRRDGASSAYYRMPIAAGEHDIKVQFNDDVRVEGFNHVREERIVVNPGQVVLIDFQEEAGVIIR